MKKLTELEEIENKLNDYDGLILDFTADKKRRVLKILNTAKKLIDSLEKIKIKPLERIQSYQNTIEKTMNILDEIMEYSKPYAFGVDEKPNSMRTNARSAKHFLNNLKIDINYFNGFIDIKVIAEEKDTEEDIKAMEEAIKKRNERVKKNIETIREKENPHLKNALWSSIKKNDILMLASLMIDSIIDDREQTQNITKDCFEYEFNFRKITIEWGIIAFIEYETKDGLKSKKQYSLMLPKKYKDWAKSDGENAIFHRMTIQKDQQKTIPKMIFNHSVPHKNLF